MFRSGPLTSDDNEHEIRFLGRYRHSIELEAVCAQITVLLKLLGFGPGRFVLFERSHVEEVRLKQLIRRLNDLQQFSFSCDGPFDPLGTDLRDFGHSVANALLKSDRYGRAEFFN